MPESPDTDLSAESSSASDEARQQALRRLAQRMRGRADMPSLGDSIVAIQRIVNSDHSHMRSLTGGVLSDVSLTAKLLRMINTATYRSGIDGGITDVQRALALLGFRSIGMMAASMLLFERLPKGSGGARVRETFSHALLAALLAEEMCHSAQDLKNSYLAGMFMNLGEMLVSLHFPEEARAIDDFLRQDTPEAGALIGAQAHERRMQASRQVLGLSIQDLGSEVASQWGWPPELRGQLRRLYPTNTQPVGPGQDYLRVLATGASDLAVELHWLRATRDTATIPSACAVPASSASRAGWAWRWRSAARRCRRPSNAPSCNGRALPTRSGWKRCCASSRLAPRTSSRPPARSLGCSRTRPPERPRPEPGSLQLPRPRRRWLP